MSTTNHDVENGWDVFIKFNDLSNTDVIKIPSFFFSNSNSKKYLVVMNIKKNYSSQPLYITFVYQEL